MKRYFFLLCCCTRLLAAAPVSDNLALLEELIVLTKKTLAEQESLHTLLSDFQKKRETFLEDPESARAATLLVKSALKLEKELGKVTFGPLFSEDLLTEIHFFSNVGKNHGTP